MLKIDVRKSSAKAAAWDEFALNCGASFRCAYRATRIWQFEVSPTHKLCRLELFVHEKGRAIKIGQCAVGISPRLNTFADSIQLLPQYSHLWSSAMTAVIKQLGPGVYSYGSNFNIEDSRETDLRKLSAVTINHVDNFFIEYVDFKQWSEWEAYLKSVSENIRRNVKKAAKHFEGYKINATTGFDLGRVIKFMTLRNKVYTRKNVQKSPLMVFMRSAMRTLAVHQYTSYAYFEADKRVVAGYCGVDFGKNIYYMEGGSEKGNQGASWSLMMNVMSRAWEQSKGQGRFIMGANSTEPHDDDPSWEGLERSRQQCRVSAQSSSIVRFTYAGERARVPNLSAAQTLTLPWTRPLARITPSSLITTALTGKETQMARLFVMLCAYLLLYRWRTF